MYDFWIKICAFLTSVTAYVIASPVSDIILIQITAVFCSNK